MVFGIDITKERCVALVCAAAAGSTALISCSGWYADMNDRAAPSTAVLACGTTNPGKVSAVRRALQAYSKARTWDIVCKKVASGVKDQPTTLEETTQGARNRAVNAVSALRASHQGTEAHKLPMLGIGIESGLFEESGNLYDVCACAVWDGEQFHVGFSCAWQLPPSVSKKIAQGMDLSQAFQHISPDPNIGDKGGAIAVMTGQRLTRPDYTVQAVQMALCALNPAHYPCASSVPRGINDESQ